MSEEPTRIPPIDEALAFMERVFGYRRFKPGQEEMIGSALDGKDILIIMPTGAGKSLCYQIPSFIRDGIALVISPLIALMKDQVDALRVRDLPAAAVHSLMSLREQEDALKRIGSGEIKLVYVSPERLRNPRFIQAVKRNRVSMVAVDEAHCISQWGHDFRPDYLRISKALQVLGHPQTIALTATATEKVRSDIITQLKLRTPRVFITGFDRRNLYWEVAAVHDETEKTALMRERLAGLSGAALVYAGTRKNVESIAESLRQDGYEAEAYHAGLEKAVRTRVQDSFMEGRTNLVVATNAFGMGIDRSDIRMVIHHAFPGSLEAYYQESGRAGRDGEPALCLLLYSPSDRRLQEFFIETRYPARERVFEIYNRLRERPEDILWLTYREIGLMGEEKISDLTVASCIKILEDAGAVKRLRRNDNRAELYLHKTPEIILSSLPKRADNLERLIRGLEKLYDGNQLTEGIRFLPEELEEMTGLSPGALRRCLSRLDKELEATYIPPFRGRGLRILRRIDPDKLDIDFQALQLRKASELEKLDQVMAYASRLDCRRRHLLDYFGDTAGVGSCGACDLCDAGRKGTGSDEERADPVLAVKILSGVARLRERFGMGMAAKVLTGSEDRMVRQFGLQRLSTYGLLSEHSQSQVLDWLGELVSGGCILSRRTSVGTKTYPVLALTDRGRRILSDREQIRLALPAKAAGSPVVNERSARDLEREIFERLRDLRSRIARKERLPSYCIFQDRTLREMAGTLPETPEELLRIIGVGEVALRKYGEDFLILIKQIRNENRPSK
ncbi:MAG: ATP-dependent DNA helicase RecQ [Pseudomonadota bacterium]